MALTRRLVRDDIENITLFSDASFCPNTRASAGACWARGNGQYRLQQAWDIRPDALDSNDAEILTTCMAIMLVAGDGELGMELTKGNKTRLVVVVDCQGVIHALERGPSERMNPRTRAPGRRWRRCSSCTTASASS